jgi:hypothetical protein
MAVVSERTGEAWKRHGGAVWVTMMIPAVLAAAITAPLIRPVRVRIGANEYTVHGRFLIMACGGAQGFTHFDGPGIMDIWQLGIGSWAYQVARVRRFVHTNRLQPR